MAAGQIPLKRSNRSPRLHPLIEPTQNASCATCPKTRRIDGIIMNLLHNQLAHGDFATKERSSSRRSSTSLPGACDWTLGAPAGRSDGVVKMGSHKGVGVQAVTNLNG